MDDEANLKTLVARLNAGEEAALNELWLKYGSRCSGGLATGSKCVACCSP
jgi:hypothetical protein